MRGENLGICLSLLVLALIPCVIDFSIWLWKRSRDKQLVAEKSLLKDNAIGVAITLAITLSICLIFRVTGFFDWQFYRPSSRDYGMMEKLGLAHEEVDFSSKDGTKLHGWFLPAKGTARGTVIHFHGSDRNITFTVGNVAWLTHHDWNVFVFDYRGYGKSAGEPSRQGLVDDSVAAVKTVAGRPDRGQGLVLYGQSMGGQLAINAAQQTHDEAINLVIAEATYARHSYHLSDKLGRMGPLWLVKWAAWLLTSDELCGEAAVSDLGPAKILLIHGSADGGVASYHSERLFDAAKNPKDIWRVEGAGHLRVFQNEANQKRLAAYLDQLLPLTNEPAVADPPG